MIHPSRALFLPQSILRQALHPEACRRTFSISLLCQNVSKTPKFPKLIGRYRAFPEDLFRINASDKVVLRDYEAQKKLGRTSYDLKTHEDGMVHPKTSEYFEGPNGASMRPNGAMMQEVVRNFRGRNTTIHLVPKGTEIPEDLVLLHEHSDHYSVQCTRPMSLRELNRTITAFMREKAQAMGKAEFDERFPFQI